MTEATWDDHADWWQREFTGGVDPEYVEQIIPLVRDHLAGARRVIDVGTGEGQIARALASDNVEVIGVDPTTAQMELAGRSSVGVYTRVEGAEHFVQDSHPEVVVGEIYPEPLFVRSLELEASAFG